jgi:hypothetical protein
MEFLTSLTECVPKVIVFAFASLSSAAVHSLPFFTSSPVWESCSLLCFAFSVAFVVTEVFFSLGFLITLEIFGFFGVAGSFNFLSFFNVLTGLVFKSFESGTGPSFFIIEAFS